MSIKTDRITTLNHLMNKIKLPPLESGGSLRNKTYSRRKRIHCF